jgi:NAD+ synthase (glutamine-hydrolysing)
MSHYSVNASVPKTLIKYLVGWVITSGQFDERTTHVLQSILDTEISPELVPGEEHAAQSAQISETCQSSKSRFRRFVVPTERLARTKR